MKIGITFNGKSLSHSSSADDLDEAFDASDTLHAIRGVLWTAGHEVHSLGAEAALLDKIKELDIDFVFNIAEGFSGRSREAHIPALLETAGVPYSGSDPLGLSLTLDKALAKRLAQSLGIATPQFWTVMNEEACADIPVDFPLFVKPLFEGSSKGVRRSSRVETPASLAAETRRILAGYGGPVLVEQYIPGREFTAGIVGNHDAAVLGVMEISYRDKTRNDFYYGLETKRNWRTEVDYALASGETAARIREMTLKFFHAVGLRDVARLDFRMAPNGKLYFLEANPLPALSPESGDLAILARLAGKEYAELVLDIFDKAAARYGSLVSERRGLENSGSAHSRDKIMQSNSLITKLNIS